MDLNKNYYQILGVDKNSNEDEIKKVFRKLAVQYHPDKNKGDKESERKFQEINEANQVLSDSKLRQEYDTRSPHGRSYSPFNPFGGGFGGGGFEFHFGGGGGDIFSQIFGNNNPFGGFGFNPFQQEEFRENLDIMVNINVDLKKIYKNENLNISYKRNVSCEDCDGTGFDRSSKSYDCEVCDGLGKDRHGKKCESCKGIGKIFTGTCTKCNGEKVISKDTEVAMQNIGSIRGSTRQVNGGFGHQSKYYRNKSGNLILNINFDKGNEYDIVNHSELHKILNVHFKDAIDGSELIFDHIDDSKFKIKLPNKTKEGDVIRIKEKGLIRNDGKRDDLYLKINIIIDYSRV